MNIIIKNGKLYGNAIIDLSEVVQAAGQGGATG